MADLEGILERHFGFQSFRPGQRRVIELLLRGHSAAAVFPTGGGKSLCYQLTALELPGLTLVVSPLIALMKDQIDALRARGIAAQRLDSSLDAEEYRSTTAALSSGRLRLLYVAPERFNNERFRATVMRLPISLFAVDEAHCISEWGHNFRPDYLKLARFVGQCEAERVLALTATATPAVLEDICRGLDIAPEHAVRTPFYRSNLTLLTTPVSAEGRDALLCQRLRERAPGATVVYVTLQRTAERVAELLTDAGLEARPYHAGMKDEARSATQDWFFGSESGVVVATIAFGMGIDKADIRYIYHYNLPKSLEGYAQEIGRAGRDGDPSICETLVCSDDLNVLENFAYGDTPSRQAIDELVAEIFALGSDFDVSLHELSVRCDIRILVLQTLLTYLELDGYLEGGTPRYSKFQFKPLMSSAEILGQFSGERRDFLSRLLRLSRKARTWFTIDVDEAARSLSSPRHRVVRALDHLHDGAMLELRATGVRHRFRCTRQPRSPETVSSALESRVMSREAAEIGRLQSVLESFAGDGCQVSALSAHFGEPLEQPCGHCSWCLGDGEALEVPPRRQVALDEEVWQEVLVARNEHGEALADSRSLVRFLCGVSSPRLSRAKLSSHPLFGALRDLPFAELLARIDREVSPSLGS